MHIIQSKTGITLIALVITIIILLIIAGITINLVVGNNGIIRRTTQAGHDYEKEAVKEEVTLILLDYTSNQYQTNQDLDSYLEQQVNEGKIESVEDNGDGTHTIIIDDYMVTIDDETLEVIDITKAKARPKISNIKVVVPTDGTEAKENEIEVGTPLKITFEVSLEEGTIEGVNIGSLIDGKVEYTTNGTEKEVSFVITGVINGEKVEKRQKVSIEKYYQKSEVEASDIAKNASKYYGQLVTNYTCPSNGVGAWRIFYADENNIYLIADDYILADDVPQSPNGLSVYRNSNFAVSMDNSVTTNNVYADETYSTGSKWIVQNSKAKQWISQFINNYPESTNINIRATAFLMDTNIWSSYYAGAKAEYAIGSPTLELFCASYKDTHQNKYVECEFVNSYGYKIKWSNETSYGLAIQSLLTNGEFNSIYVKSDQSKVMAMALASPSGQFAQFLARVGCGGIIYTDGSYNDRQGLRPVVCLKSNTKIQKTVNGYEIVDET